MSLEKVIFGFFVLLAATLNFGFFIGDLSDPTVASPPPPETGFANAEAPAGPHRGPPGPGATVTRA